MAQKPSRRGLLSLAAVAPLAALGAPVPTAAADGDQELIDACDRLVAARAEMLHLYAGPGSPADPDNHPIVGPKLDALDAVEDELLPRLTGMRANSVACAEAMARVALIFADCDRDYQVPERGREWPITVAARWLAGVEFSRWATTSPQFRDRTPPPPVRRI